jgi:hypothetical protein
VGSRTVTPLGLRYDKFKYAASPHLVLSSSSDADTDVETPRSQEVSDVD